MVLYNVIQRFESMTVMKLKQVYRQQNLTLPINLASSEDMLYL